MSLSIDDLKVLQEKLFGVSNKWYNIGLQLLLNADTLDNIRSNCGSSTQDCLLEVLKKWLRRVDPYPTWKAIVDALKSIVVGEQRLAQKLEDEYCKQDNTRSLSSAQPDTQKENKVLRENDALKAEILALRAEKKLRQAEESDLKKISDGYEVIAKRCFTIQGDQAQHLEWKCYGVRLHIPEDVLSSNESKGEVEVQVSLSGQYVAPDDDELVSAVYWIATRNLSKPIRIETQHCAASVGSSSQLSVAITTNKKPPFIFSKLEGGAFSPFSSFASFPPRESFSGLAVVMSRNAAKRYCAQLWYAKLSPQDWRIHFIITRDLYALLTAVDALYSDDGEKGLSVEVGFEGDQITMDIPKKGVTSQGWRIWPRYQPSITKQVADSYCSERWLPVCELAAQWEGEDEQPAPLHHEIDLIGAQPPTAYLSLDLEPKGISAQRSPDMLPGELLQHQLAGSDKVEVKDQQIQTETIKTEEQHVQVGSMTLQQADSGKVEMKDEQFETETVKTKDQYVQAGSTALQQGYLRGVEVIDHTSFTYMGQANSFDWVNHGFKLHLPEKALPLEVEKCDIHVKVSLSGQFQFPDGSDLISGIYWIFIPHVFVQPVTVEIQHCIQFFSPEDSDNLRFVVAKCSQKNLPYQFKILEGGVFSPHSSYGSIQLTQFSGVGTIRRDKHHTRTRKGYCAKLYYIPKNSAGWDVHFVITLNMELHMSAVRSEYATMGARVGPHQNVMFAGKEITLDIPLEGITLDSGWTITPLVHPGIMKYEVDFFVPGKRVPSCQLYIKWNSKEKQSDELLYRVKLVGAKEPFNFFNIYPTASTPLPVDGPETLTTQLQTGHITSDERPNLLKLLNFPGRSGSDISIPKEIGTKYCLFGVRLLNDETGAEVSTIATKYHEDAEQINLEILRLWVGGKGRPLSWGMLIDTLRASGLNTLASDIQNGLQH